MVAAFSAPNFRDTRLSNSAWYPRQSWARSLRTKRTVETIRAMPMIARMTRSRARKGAGVRFSMSDPRRHHRPGLPRPVEVPVRAAAERPHEREQQHCGHHQQEDQVLGAAVAGEPPARRRGPA